MRGLLSRGEFGTRGDVALIALTLFFLAVTVRLAFFAWRGPQYNPDSAQYALIARNLRSHGAYSLSYSEPFIPTIRRVPVYPLFLAAFEWTGEGPPMSVFFVQIAIDAAVTVGILLLARALVPLGWAAGAALIYAFEPGVVYYSVHLLSEMNFAAILVASVAALSLGWRRDALDWTVAGGLGLGLAILSRPVGLLLPLAFLAALYAAKGVRRKRLHGAVMLACVAALVVPWSVRSSLLAGRVVVVQSAGAVNVLGAARQAQPDVRTSHLPKTMAVTPVDQAHVDRLRYAEALKIITADPGAYLLARARIYPFLFLTSFDQVTNIHRSFRWLAAKGDVTRFGFKLFLLVVFALGPFVLAFVGLKRAWDHPTTAMSAAVWIYTLVIHLPLWIEYRFWLPAVPFMLLSAVSGAYMLYTRLRLRGREEVEARAGE